MIVFDLDDTLFPEIDYVHSGYRAIGRELERHGIMSENEAVGFLMASDNTARGFDDLSARIWLSHPGSHFDVKWMVDTYRYHTPDICLDKETESTLAGLRDKGITLGIITDGRSATQLAKIKALGLDRFIHADNIVVSSEIGADKTSELPFITVAERNPNEREFMYVGDNPAKDFRWPNAMGWDTVMLLDKGQNIHSQRINVSPDYRAHHTISSITEIALLQ